MEMLGLAAVHFGHGAVMECDFFEYDIAILGFRVSVFLARAGVICHHNDSFRRKRRTRPFQVNTLLFAPILRQSGKPLFQKPYPRRTSAFHYAKRTYTAVRHFPEKRMRTRGLSIVIGLFLAGCAAHTATHGPIAGQFLSRQGDEMVVCGQFVHTGAPVVTWLDPGGFDAYRVERRFASWPESDWDSSAKTVNELKTPNRFGLRKAGLTADQIEQVRGGGWPLALLQQRVDQFVLHYDGCGTSRFCFNILHDHRDLSVHFLLDLDGTIYQTLDLKERAWHATTSNDRSIGIEIANVGAFAEREKDPLAEWYRRDADGHLRIIVPLALGGGKHLRTPDFVGRPIREQIVVGEVQGKTLRQYDLTPQQYDSLVKLTAALCTVFPKIKCDYPRDGSGKLVSHQLPKEQLAAYQGVLGHYHVQSDKIDPGPALQWDRVIEGARERMTRGQ
jgi:N-acetylmuramoyl-L-alanine amidase